MIDGLKITELPYTAITRDDDLIPIVQDGVTKSAKKKDLHGKDGITPNIQIGMVETVNYDQFASVEVSGTKENPLLDFRIPRGYTGATPVISIGTVETIGSREQAAVTIDTTIPETPIMGFKIPRGIMPEISLDGTVVAADQPGLIRLDGDLEYPIIHMEIPRGPKGEDGFSEVAWDLYLGGA